MFETLSAPALLDAMGAAQRDERSATARRLLAVGRFALRRLAELGDAHGNWCVDDWEAVAAEVGAELGISRQWASSQMHHGTTLIERLPKLGEVFATGEVDYRIVDIAISRTQLVVDEGVLAQIDRMLARQVRRWNKLSRRKITERVDWMVIELDPEAVRVARESDADRHIEVTPGHNGTAEVYGTLRAAAAVALDQRLDELAATVCADDPRTKGQRRADAVDVLTAGGTAMPCECGREDCPADPAGVARSKVVIHVLADAATVEGHGAAPALLAGYGTVPAEAVRRLTPTAKVRALHAPTGEDRYRPSAKLADFVRCRDLSCRFPGCDEPAERCDVDHTVPYPAGPTHPSNLKAYCRTHHLLKTFFAGPGGWSERQSPDGTVTWTSPTGRRYVTVPDGALFFPQLAQPTGHVPAGSAAGGGLAMPTRRRTRTQEREYRIEWERGLNRARYAADPPPF
ncbi:HNH endonuclease signature motif containing protein [Mycolicibacterium sp. F2034L]|uniref:HNH endonuclease signature motif containing protein n=1 Tax=Mycolicibacterium sp. F2034L TaxID=2926422 RepID=UPI001FF6CD7D|nr:HNH endonuclease signature motif containing protein [Mycolicibacterium sp. F2034L]MCK0176273.1 HNH endonuclease [Mycolicibacterium sp. F2034L]